MDHWPIHYSGSSIGMDPRGGHGENRGPITSDIKNYHAAMEASMSHEAPLRGGFQLHTSSPPLGQCPPDQVHNHSPPQSAVVGPAYSGSGTNRSWLGASGSWTNPDRSELNGAGYSNCAESNRYTQDIISMFIGLCTS